MARRKVPGLGKASVSLTNVKDDLDKTSLNNSKVLKEKNIENKENILANKRRERSASRTGSRTKINDEIPLDRSGSKKDKKEILELKDKMELVTKERDF